MSKRRFFSYQSTFSGKLRLHEEDNVILRVLSLVLWTLTRIPLCKHIITVSGADDNGEGGNFAWGFQVLLMQQRMSILLTLLKHLSERREAVCL
ncbi:probable potassium transporter 13 [Mangifera indica]|uniref:probable potassium transporter 13 n=1 Tax=Mangifera indica TaxID=29780 RepID=UPI001CFA9B8D|nr:probable potassium transporter 13 [Mangifera indica]